MSESISNQKYKSLRYCERKKTRTIIYMQLTLNKCNSYNNISGGKLQHIYISFIIRSQTHELEMRENFLRMLCELLLLNYVSTQNRHYRFVNCFYPIFIQSKSYTKVI